MHNEETTGPFLIRYKSQRGEMKMKERLRRSMGLLRRCGRLFSPSGVQVRDLESLGQFKRRTGRRQELALEFLSLKNLFHLVLGEGFVLDQSLGQELEFIALLGQDFGGLIPCLLDEATDLPLNLLLCFGGKTIIVGG
jgi:hypothetical protein